MSIGKRIIQARTEAGLNQSQLAKQLNVSPQSVQHWENDRTIPRNKRVQELSELLKVSSSWLQGFANLPNQQSLKVLDNRMSPRIIQGDTVTINPDITELMNDGIFALTQNGEMQLRRATSKSDGRWLLSCDNRELAECSEVYSDAEAKNLNIFGMVTKVTPDNLPAPLPSLFHPT